MNHSNRLRPARLRVYIATFCRACRGIAAIEFALIAPIFVSLFLSMTALYSQNKVQRDIQQTAASLSDVVARYTTMDDTKLASLGAAAEALLLNNTSVDEVRLAVSVFYNPRGRYQRDYTILWSKTYNNARPINNSDIRGNLNDLPIIRRKLNGNSLGDTMVLLRMEVDVDPLFELPGLSERGTIERKAWAYPRYAQAIEYIEDED